VYSGGIPNGIPLEKRKNISDYREKAADEMFCSSCGEIIKKEAEICPKCGVRHKQPPSTTIANSSKKDWLTTLLLAIFLSVFGVHRVLRRKNNQRGYYDSDWLGNAWNMASH
jgi:TM2 domain-containing membrane protein YozV